MGTRGALRRHYAAICAAFLLLVFAAELTLSIRQQSLSWDEGDHIFAGYMSWKTRDFGINPEHPPLVKALAALPLLAMHLKTPAPWVQGDFKEQAYFDGAGLIFDNGGEQVADRIVFRARMAAAILSLLLGLLVFLAGREMFGAGAGLFALALIVFEPNMIAHGAYVTTDMGVSCFMFASVYALYRYVKAPSRLRLLVVGLAAGLALAAKHSATLLLPIGVCLVVAEILLPEPGLHGGPGWVGGRGVKALRLAGVTLVTAVVAVVVLWGFYYFRYAARPGGVALNPTLVQYAAGLHGIEPRIYLSLARWHILPESYLYGLVDIRLQSLSGSSFPTYIFGQVHAHGVWYYFPVAFAIKSTLAFMVLLLLAVGAVALRKLRARREVLFLGIPPAVYLLIAMETGLNIGARHILPMYGFLAVLIAGAVIALTRIDRRWAYVAGLLLAWHAVSASRAYPVYLAYSNELWGGPDETYKYLTDSNVDWGQQLKGVKAYVDSHGIKDCWFAYFSSPVIPFQAYGIPCRMLPTADTIWFDRPTETPATVTGTVFISAGTLTGYEFGSKVLNPYRGLQEVAPVAVIQHGVFVYQGTFDMRFASALGHVARATELGWAKNYPAELVEAQAAAGIDPDEMQAEVALGDALARVGRKAEAKAAYEKAAAIAGGMEPGAKADWLWQIGGKVSSLGRVGGAG